MRMVFGVSTNNFESMQISKMLQNIRVSKLSKGAPTSFEISNENTKSLKNKSKIAPNARN